MRFLKLVFIVAGLLALIFVVLSIGLATWLYGQAPQSNLGELRFDNRLDVPPLLEPEIDEQGRKVFDLRFTPGEVELIPGKRTETGTQRLLPLAGTARLKG